VSSRFVPGMYVRHPDLPAWGLGQVQSAVGDRITVNFEHAGKRLINGAIVLLIEVDIGRDTPPGDGTKP
jgi:Protein of unknown function (DUF3553)